MKKRILSLTLALSMLTAFVPVIMAQAASINIGDYVQMGTYYGEPILWRCVDKDDNGPLMLADKIICLKPYDAETSSNNTTGSHSRSSYRQSYESNYWGDSNMRSWLNSSASAGNVEWLCGNPPIESEVYYNAYDQEAGFMTNFTTGELNAVKEVTQKSLVAYPEYNNGIYTMGSEAHDYSYHIDSVVQNYDTAYAENITDKFFLLDVKQVNAVYNNSDVLGEDYYIGEPTEQCVANSEYTSSSLAVGKKWYYWLRSPGACYGSYVRYVDSSGVVFCYNAFLGDYGVRPAFYLADSAAFSSGDGTESSPYTIEDTGTSDTEIIASGKYSSIAKWTLTKDGTLSITPVEGKDVSSAGGNGDWASQAEYEEYLNSMENDSPWSDYTEMIKRVDIAEGITYIYWRAFTKCVNLTDVSLPSTLKSIPNYAFLGCTSLESIDIPDSVIRIGAAAFYDCTKLADIKLSSNLTCIYNDAFRNYAFYNTPVYNDESNWENGVLYIDNYLISANTDESQTEYEIKDGTQVISDGAFWGCGSLASITVPESVTDIGDTAFSGCESLTNINVSENNTNYCSVDGNLFDNSKTELVQYAIGKTNETYNIPNGVTTIGYKAFSGCVNLESVTIPDSISEIGDYTFSGCENLTSVAISDSVTSIYYSAFYGCNNLTDIYYSGSEEEWNEIQIDNENDCLTNANIHYNSTGIPNPSIETVGVTNNDNEYSFTVSLSDVLYGCKLMAVSYDEYGMMTGFTYTALHSGDDEKEITVLADNADTAKIMIWSGIDSIKPLCEAKTVDLTELTI